MVMAMVIIINVSVVKQTFIVKQLKHCLGSTICTPKEVEWSPICQMFTIL